MPTPYSTNEVPRKGIGEMGLGNPEPEFIERGLDRLAEALQCLGGQLAVTSDKVDH
jgi:hypothetical protein